MNLKDWTPADDRVCGQLVRIFSALEHQVLKLHVTSLQMIADQWPDDKKDEWFREQLAHGLGARIKNLRKIMDAGGFDQSSIESVMEGLDGVAVKRNLFCHSSWGKSEDGRCEFWFFDREAWKRNSPIIARYTHIEIERLAVETKKKIVMLKGILEKT